MYLSQTHSRPSGSRGFTLIELLLAITLLGLILTMAYSGLSSSTRAVDRGEDYIDRINRVRLVQQFIRNQLSRALPLIMADQDRADDDVANTIIFEGEGEMMRWVAPMPGYLGRGGPHEQVLAIQRGENGNNLVYAFKLLGSNEDYEPLDNPDRPPVILIEGVASGQFQYMSVDDENEPTDWMDDWEDPSLSPLVVRIDLDMNAETRIDWPTLDVAPLIDGMTTRNNPNILVPGSGIDRNNNRQNRDGVIDAGREANNKRDRDREQREQEQ